MNQTLSHISLRVTLDSPGCHHRSVFCRLRGIYSLTVTVLGDRERLRPKKKDASYPKRDLNGIQATKCRLIVLKAFVTCFVFLKVPNHYSTVRFPTCLFLLQSSVPQESELFCRRRETCVQFPSQLEWIQTPILHLPGKSFQEQEGYSTQLYRAIFAKYSLSPEEKQD